MPEHDPTLFIIGGCNGAGKTTFARRLLPMEGVELFLNADEIARGLSPLKPELSALHGRLLLENAHDLIAKRKSFGLESTLSGKTYARLLSEAKAAGFFISLHFLVVPSAEVSIERVAHRVSKGGHHVPDDDIRRRFTRSVENFLHLFLPLSDEWEVWDNQGEEPKLLATSAEMSQVDVVQLLTGMTLRETPPRTLRPSTERALRALQLAYEDAKAENARWGLPMIPQDWTPEDWERVRRKHAKKA